MIPGQANLKINGVWRLDRSICTELNGRSLHKSSGSHDDITVISRHCPRLRCYITVYRCSCLDSLIKNPGGGLAPIGGYIVGKKECVENAAYRLTSPGLGKEVGASLGVIQSFYQGFFMAPTVVSGALKGDQLTDSCYG